MPKAEADVPQTKQPTRKRTKQLKVVLDTSVLHTGSASDLVRREVADLIKSSKFPDLDVQWYLAEIVKHERQYQMQAVALKLFQAVQKLENLLGHQLTTADLLIDRVDKTVRQKQGDLGLTSLQLDHARVDWHRLILDALYRRLPFEDGEKEKGFRDALLLESFVQLVEDSPKAATACRLVFVTADGPLSKAAEIRLADARNARVLPSLQELKELINTLVSEVDEQFIAGLRPKAQRLFFVSKDDRRSLYYTAKVREQITSKFKSELAAIPKGATNRHNGFWHINPPKFMRKDGQRIWWTTLIRIETKASRIAAGKVHLPAFVGKTFPLLGELPYYSPSGKSWQTQLFEETQTTVSSGSWVGHLGGDTVTTHEGGDIYEVVWSSEITTAKGLRRPRIEEINHVETKWELAA
jgi:hypothetical protein